MHGTTKACSMLIHYEICSIFPVGCRWFAGTKINWLNKRTSERERSKNKRENRNHGILKWREKPATEPSSKWFHFSVNNGNLWFFNFSQNGQIMWKINLWNANDEFVVKQTHTKIATHVRWFFFWFAILWSKKLGWSVNCMNENCFYRF